MSTPSIPDSVFPAGRDHDRRASWPVRTADGIRADLRQASRQFRKSPGFTATTLVTLALCIGATTAIFSIVYSLMLRPLPFQDSTGIVEIFTSAHKAGLNKMPSNVTQYVDFKKNAKSFETLSLWGPGESMFGEEGSSERIQSAAISAELFDLLRVRPLLGSFFTAENNKTGQDNVAVLTQSFWEQHFGEDPGIIGKTIRVDSVPLKIIGVAPRAMSAFDAQVKFFRPVTWTPQQEDPRGRYALYIFQFGRLKKGVTVAQANAEIGTLEKRYYDAAPPPTRTFMERSGVRVEVGEFQAERVEPVRSTLLLLQAGVAFVLLIGCVNVANLLLVRSNVRESELAIRSALGASRATIARQLVTESLLLTGWGALLGMAVAWGSLRAFNHFMAKMLPQSLPSALDPNVLGFAVLLTVVIGVLIGLVPVFHVLRSNLVASIQQSSRSASSGRGLRFLSSSLVVVQVGVALMLLTGAGLLIHSFAKVLQVDPGFDPHGVITGRVALPAAHRSSDEAAKGIQDRLQQAFLGIPGVHSAAFSFSTPFRGGIGINALTLADDPLPPGSPQPGAWRVVVSSDYYATMKLRMVAGRFFNAGDADKADREFVVDESFARKFFPKGSAIGGKLSFGGRPEKEADWPTVIGVVKDVPHNGVEEKSGNPYVYQLPQGRPGGMTWFLRTERPAGSVIAEMREKIHAIDPTIPLFDTSTLEEEMSGSFDNRRAVMYLLMAFAGIALFLSALGIYGVLAYDVSQRTREIGIRGAIGASRGQIVQMILRQGLVKAVIGLVAGIIGALLLSRFMTSLLFQVKPADPVVYVGVAVLLLLVALLASYVPARRASRIDPIVALRYE
jgi:predicted permease